MKITALILVAYVHIIPIPDVLKPYPLDACQALACQISGNVLECGADRVHFLPVGVNSKHHQSPFNGAIYNAVWVVHKNCFLGIRSLEVKLTRFVCYGTR